MTAVCPSPPTIVTLAVPLGGAIAVKAVRAPIVAEPSACRLMLDKLIVADSLYCDALLEKPNAL